MPARSSRFDRRKALTVIAGAPLAAAAKRAAADEKDVAPAKPARAIPANAGLVGIQKWLKQPEPVTWVFTGDSITHGALHTLGWRSYPEHFAERVRWELRRMRDVVINTGISGDRTGGFLTDIDWRALRFEPHVVSLMFGMNDCTAGEAGREKFRKLVQALVDKIMEAGAIPLLNTPNTILGSGGRGDLPAYAEIVREVATNGNIALVDHWQNWQTKRPKPEDVLPWLEDKTIHPGVLGHREFAHEVFRTLGIFDPASPTCKLEV